MNKQKEVITPAQAARRLGRTQRTVEEWLLSGTCPFGTAYRHTSGRNVYIIPIEAFERFLRGELRGREQSQA